MGPLNIVLWLAGVALIAVGYCAGAGPVGALPGAQGTGRQRRPLRGVARRRPRRQHDRRLGRDGDPAPAGADRRGRSRSSGSSWSSSGSSSADGRGRGGVRRQPCRAIRPSSMAVQRSITTSSPPRVRDRARPPSSTTPSWSHSQRAPTATASRACGTHSSGRRKTSTMSNGPVAATASTTRREARHRRGRRARSD